MLLVIGYGNPLRGDDGIGQIVARRLSERVNHPGASFIARHQLTPELVEPISQASTVIFIDAFMGRAAGFLTIHEVQPRPDAGALQHLVTPASLLAGAWTLYGRCPRGLLVSVEGEAFDFGDELSPDMRRTLPAMLRALQQVIQRQLALEARWYA